MNKLAVEYVPFSLDDREVLAVLTNSNDTSPRYFIELGWRGGLVIAIRDFRYVHYIAQESVFELAA